MKTLTIGQMIKKVEAWINQVSEFYDFVPCYRIEKDRNVDGDPIFRFCHDADINYIINGYRDDGHSKEAGSQFERITDNTNWCNEAESSSVEYFCRVGA